MKIVNSEILFSGVFLLALGLALIFFVFCQATFELENCKVSPGNPRNFMIVFVFIGMFLIGISFGRKEKTIFSHLKCPTPTRNQLIFFDIVLVVGFISTMILGT
jgi:uncharacterized membrane protein YidH (DUF202 family)